MLSSALASKSGVELKVTIDQSGLKAMRKAEHKVRKVKNKLEPTGTKWIPCLSISSTNYGDAGEARDLRYGAIPTPGPELRECKRGNCAGIGAQQVSQQIRDNMCETPPCLPPNTDFQSIKCYSTSTSPILYQFLLCQFQSLILN